MLPLPLMCVEFPISNRRRPWGEAQCAARCSRTGDFGDRSARPLLNPRRGSPIRFGPLVFVARSGRFSTSLVCHARRSSSFPNASHRAAPSKSHPPDRGRERAPARLRQQMFLRCLPIRLRGPTGSRGVVGTMLPPGTPSRAPSSFFVRPSISPRPGSPPSRR